MNTARRLLMPLSLLYGGVTRVRNAAYDRVPALVRRASVPVISIGNITVGGTGKTPMVVDVVRRLHGLGRRPAVLTRGYKGTIEAPADEVLELRAALPGVPIVVDRDRTRGAAAAVHRHHPDCVVLDDGFQHRRLARDMDIVLIDALDPWGGSAVLPAGRLREPLGGLRRADVLVITRTNQLPPAQVDEIARELARWTGDKPIWRAAVAADVVVDSAGRSVPPTELADRRVFVVCGLGNPATFGRLLATLGATLVGELALADHHRYVAADAERITAAATRAGAEQVVTTRKDWVKLVPLWSGRRLPLARVDVRVTWPDTATEFDARLRRALEGHR